MLMCGACSVGHGLFTNFAKCRGAWLMCGAYVDSSTKGGLRTVYAVRVLLYEILFCFMLFKLNNPQHVCLFLFLLFGVCAKTARGAWVAGHSEP